MNIDYSKVNDQIILMSRYIDLLVRMMKTYEQRTCLREAYSKYRHVYWGTYYFHRGKMRLDDICPGYISIEHRGVRV